ncbi:MAG TPA: hypothetical protein VEI52_24605 [Terriglobales bacterium]|nr:hypothetical protein [Terriglobales bacterium]
MAYDSGYLLYVVEQTLMARPFDVNRMEFAGDAVPVAEGVQVNSIFSDAVFSASGNGVLLYQTGDAFSQRKLEVVDATGKTLGKLGEHMFFTAGLRISPEGKRVVYGIINPSNGQQDLWIQDIASGTRTRLTVDTRRSAGPAWSPGGERIAYQSSRSGKPVPYVVQANGMGVEQKLAWEPKSRLIPTTGPQIRRS